MEQARPAARPYNGTRLPIVLGGRDVHGTTSSVYRRATVLLATRRMMIPDHLHREAQHQYSVCAHLQGLPERAAQATPRGRQGPDRQCQGDMCIIRVSGNFEHGPAHADLNEILNRMFTSLRESTLGG